MSVWQKIGTSVFQAQSIDINDLGYTIVVGNEFEGSVNNGKVRVLYYDGNDWIQIGNTIESDSTIGNGKFGEIVRINDTGDIILVSEPNYSYVNNNVTVGLAGRVKSYKLINGTWNQIGQDIVGDYYSAQLGTSTAISADGKNIIIGTQGRPVGEFYQYYGDVKIYTYDEENNIWNQLGQTIWNTAYINNLSGITDPNLLRPDGIAKYANSLSISNNNRIIIGYPLIGDQYPTGTTGRAKIYSLNQYLNWNTEKTIENTYDTDGRLGSIVRISNDGQVFAIGGILQKGKIFVYYKQSDTSSIQQIGPYLTNNRYGRAGILDFDLLKYLDMIRISIVDQQGLIDVWEGKTILEPQVTFWQKIGDAIQTDSSDVTTVISNNSSILGVLDKAFDNNTGMVTLYDSPPLPSLTPTRTPTKTPQATPTQTASITPTQTESTTPTPTQTLCYDQPDGFPPLHNYDIQNTQSLSDEFGGQDLLSNGGSITVNGYEFNSNQGLTLFNTLENIFYYSISIDFELKSTDVNTKIVDFKNRSFDNGIYLVPIENNKFKINLKFQPINNLLTEQNFNLNQRNRITLVRKEVFGSNDNILTRTPTFIVLINNEKIIEVPDIEEFGVAENNVFQLFIDDIFTSSESSSGIIYKISTFNEDLTKSVCLLSDLPTPTPTLTPTLSPTPTNTETPLPTVPLATQSLTPFPTASPTATETAGASPTPTTTLTSTPTNTPTNTETPTTTPTPTYTPTVTVTKTRVSKFNRLMDCCPIVLSQTPTCSSSSN